MHLVRDVLDQRLIDRHQQPMGRVDGLVLEWRAGEPPRVAYIETGWAALAHRLNWRLAKWLLIFARGLVIKKSEEFRIPWNLVRKIGVDIEVDLDAEETPAFATERWLREKVIKRIPGA